MTFRKMLHRFQKFWVLLAHDLAELRGPHPSLLHLLKGSASIDSLMLPRVPDDEHAVLRFDLAQECPHLLGADEAGRSRWRPAAASLGQLSLLSLGLRLREVGGQRFTTCSG
jgi:hypothetical protein